MIRDVSQTLIDVIHANTLDLGAWVSPVGLEEDSGTPPANRLALSLYSIEEHGHMRNRPAEFDGERFRRAPVVMRLSYVMAYYGASGATNHLESQARLDRVVQVFHTLPILRSTELGAGLLGVVDQLAVRLWSPTADERNQIWTAFGRPMRLALYYLVDAVPIVPSNFEGSVPIVEQRIDYESAVGQ